MSRFCELFNKVFNERNPTELAMGWLRYEAIRKLNPRQFDELYRRNIAGENFDTMVDQLFWKKLNETVAQLGMNTSEAKARESASLSFQVDAGSNPASLTNDQEEPRHE